MDLNTKRLILDITAWTAGALAVILLVADAAAVDRRALRANSAAWREECGSCHVAFPPALLPAASWQAIMNGLDKHFDSDASLDPKTTAQIRDFLTANAARNREGATRTVTLRITDTNWFRREHARVNARTSPNPGVKGPADCTACHSGAAHGDFDERSLRIPR